MDRMTIGAAVLRYISYCKKVKTKVLISKEVLFGLWKAAPPLWDSSSDC